MPGRDKITTVLKSGVSIMAGPNALQLCLHIRTQINAHLNNAAFYLQLHASVYTPEQPKPHISMTQHDPQQGMAPAKFTIYFK